MKMVLIFRNGQKSTISEELWNKHEAFYKSIGYRIATERQVMDHIEATQGEAVEVVEEQTEEVQVEKPKKRAKRKESKEVGED